LHEVGHTMDLGHSNVPDAIMSAFYEGISKDFSDDDQEAINKAWTKYKSNIK